MIKLLKLISSQRFWANTKSKSQSSYIQNSKAAHIQSIITIHITFPIWHNKICLAYKLLQQIKVQTLIAIVIGMI